MHAFCTKARRKKILLWLQASLKGEKESVDVAVRIARSYRAGRQQQRPYFLYLERIAHEKFLAGPTNEWVTGLAEVTRHVSFHFAQNLFVFFSILYLDYKQCFLVSLARLDTSCVGNPSFRDGKHKSCYD